MNPGFEPGPPKSEAHDNLQTESEFLQHAIRTTPYKMTENFTSYQKTFK